ncbi:MAG: hypothetical protein KTR31_22005 [Myxococcales bacterium]|nr:hypothetical protein [Myxococcales bacterium]
MEGRLDDAEQAVAPESWPRFHLHSDLALAVTHSCRAVVSLLRGQHKTAIHELDLRRRSPGVPLAKADRQEVSVTLTNVQERSAGWIPYAEVIVAAQLLAVAADDSAQQRVTLRVGPQLTWVQTTDAPPLDLRRRRVPRRLLARLLTAHSESPGTAVSGVELMQAAWPNDRAKPSSLKNRLWAALSKLRKQGLGRAIESVQNGYRIPPEMHVTYQGHPSDLVGSSQP